jgi:3-dehydroquinate synthase
MTTSKKFTSQSKFLRNLSSIKLFSHSDFLVYDSLLDRYPAFSKWREGFRYRLAVESGEELKSLRRLEEFCAKALPILAEIATPRIVICGGGSVGDFAAFFASIYRRGVALVHVPSTWLAAIDSAHGGKTALNVGPYKNQLGSFYPADAVYLVDELLRLQPEARAIDASAELWKMAALTRRPWGKDYLLNPRYDSVPAADLVWKFLKAAIDEKYAIVARDPFERLGLRRKLNLGHTMAHALELSLRIPHGEAVGWGLAFALHFSLLKRKITRTEYQRLYKSLHNRVLKNSAQKNPWTKISSGDLERAFLADKKRQNSGKLDYVFFSSKKQVEVLPVKVQDLMKPLRDHEL